MIIIIDGFATGIKFYAKGGNLESTVAMMYCMMSFNSLMSITAYFPFLFNRFWNIIGEKEVCAVWKSNEEFCHIVVDTGIFDHHMPDSVQGAIERLHYHQVHGKEKLPDASVAIQRNAKRAKTVGATIDRSSDDKKKKDPRIPYCRSNTEPEGLCTLAPDPVCRVDGANDLNIEETITAAKVNGDTHEAVNIQKDMVEVTVHIPQEGACDELTAV